MSKIFKNKIFFLLFFTSVCFVNTSLSKKVKKVFAESDIVFHYQDWDQPFSWKNCDDGISLDGIELSYSVSDFGLTKTCVENIKDLILNMPDVLFKENLRLIQSLEPKAYEFLPFDLDTFIALQEECPVFSLAECHECLLNRTTDLGCRSRDYFEKAVAENVEHGYVNLGGGLAFQDLIILTRVLEKNPNAAINLYFVDPMHEEYIEALCENNITQIDLAKIDFLQLFKKCCYCSKALLDIRWSHECFKQLLRFLKEVYPDSTVKIFLYSYIEDFFEKCQDGTVRMPSVVMSSDLGKCDEARRAFTNLVSYAFEHQKKSKAFFLDKDKQTGRAHIYIWPLSI